MDLVGLAAVWLVSYGAIGAWFPGSDPQARLAGALLASIFSWRLYLFAFRIILRPDEPEARLASMSDAEAARCFALLSNVVLTVIGCQYRPADPDRYQDATGVPWLPDSFWRTP